MAKKRIRKTAKDALKEFVEFKNDIIFNATQIEMFTDEDFEDIDSWDEEECLAILQKIYNELDDEEGWWGDGDACPWCVKTRECANCDYGKRHGLCDDDDSEYQSVKELLDGEMVFDDDIGNKLVKALKKAIRGVEDLDK